eukprot:15084464-Heterocapsa_arctica.AAC.1
MKLPPNTFTADDFLCTEDEIADSYVRDASSRSSGGKKDPSYASEHSELYLKQGISWPPSLETLVAELG